MKNLLIILGVALSLNLAAQTHTIKADRNWRVEMHKASESLGIIDSVYIYTTARTESTEGIVHRIVSFHGAKVRFVIVAKRKRERFVLFYHEPLIIGG